MIAADTALVARIDAAFALVDPAEFAGEAEVAAETATRLLESARMFAAGARRPEVARPWEAASIIRREAERVRAWAPFALWIGLIRAADALHKGSW